MAAVAMGARGVRVVAVEPDGRRRAFLSETLGLEAIGPEELGRADPGAGADAAIECSGNAEAVALALGALRKAGTLVLAGVVPPGQAAPIPLTDVTQREITVKGAWLNPGDFAASIRLVHEHREVLAQVSTRVFGLEAVRDAFELASKGTVHKVLVKP